jgi:hypothetical protein
VSNGTIIFVGLFSLFWQPAASQKKPQQAFGEAITLLPE